MSINNRGTVRKWLTANGLPAMYVVALPMKRLQAVYNDTSGRELERMRKEANAAQELGDGAEGGQGQGQGNGQGNGQGDGGNGGAGDGDGDGEGEGEGEAEGQQEQKAKAKAEGGNGGDMSPLEREVLNVVEKHGYKPGGGAHIVRIERKDSPAVEIEGKAHPAFARVLRLLLEGANVLLVGPAGCGKTHMASMLAKALGVRYGAIHGSAGASESQLTGWLLPVGEGGKFEYVPSLFVTLYEGGDSLFLFDEIDAFDSNMLMTANGALANGHLFVPHRYHAPCIARGNNARIMAAANTYGTGANPMYSARAPLDTSTLDRFVTVTMDYDTAFESELAKAEGLTESQASELWELRKAVREQNLRRVISTRAFQKAGQCLRAGDSWKVTKATLVEGWTKDEKSKVGM